MARLASHLAAVERERKLERIRGRAKDGAARKRRTTGPRFAQLELEAQRELERYALEAGRDWRTDLIADCLRGGTRRRARFEQVLCPLVRKHGPGWLRRELKVPWEGGSRGR